MTMFKDMRLNIESTINSIIQLVYFMRGSISYNDMMNMTFAERELIGGFIKERLETESKRMNPVY